ncbi:unnamed protein product [Moneuplotes crassus]|uniref:Uncharacterized protein n=1 Tax=Euplotes crassus TaxID=5936 RepID=A0AAD1Y603_EUPCR|nr:unnamed protein product [Moneuplotes crassus]
MGGCCSDTKVTLRDNFNFKKTRQPKESVNQVKEIEKQQKKALDYPKKRISPLDFSPDKINSFYKKNQQRDVEQLYSKRSIVETGGTGCVTKEDKSCVSIYRY